MVKQSFCPSKRCVLFFGMFKCSDRASCMRSNEIFSHAKIDHHNLKVCWSKCACVRSSHDNILCRIIKYNTTLSHQSFTFSALISLVSVNGVSVRMKGLRAATRSAVALRIVEDGSSKLNQHRYQILKWSIESYLTYPCHMNLIAGSTRSVDPNAWQKLVVNRIISSFNALSFSKSNHP